MKKTDFLFTTLLACFLLFTGCRKEIFIVTFNPNGGEGAIVTQTYTEKVNQPLMANLFTNKGYTFSGWNTAPDGNGAPFANMETIIVSENMVLYAQWKPASGSFTVTFNPNGATAGKMEEQTFEAGETKPLLANQFHYRGYKFTGWCTSANGSGEKFVNQQPVTITSDMNLYAQWERILQTLYVLFYANNDTDTMKYQPFLEGVYQNLDSNDFKHDGFNFKEWNTENDGKGQPYQDKERIRIFTNLKLYAIWDTIKH